MSNASPLFSVSVLVKVMLPMLQSSSGLNAAARSHRSRGPSPSISSATTNNSQMMNQAWMRSVPSEAGSPP